MYKAIVFVRTSTDVQEMESQQQVTVDFCKKDGYTDDQIKIIGTNGASAIKLDKAYLQDIQTIYDTCKENPIEGIYGFDIDRLGRNEMVLVTLKQFCIDNRINLRIYVSNLSLLNEDKTVNDGTNILFTLLAAQAASEMRTKKARFARAKKRNAEQGKFSGGKIHFGYCLDSNGYVIVNEQEAELIKLMFNLYRTGEYSTPKLTKELQLRGYTTRGKAVSLHFVNNMLKSTAFVGYTEWNGVRRSYPRIISDKLYNDVQKQLTANHKGEIGQQSKHIHLATKLIICPSCGRHWYAANRSYCCIGHKYHGQDLQGYQTCANKESISVDWVDVAVWSVAKSEEMAYIYDYTQSKEQEAKEQIEVNKKKIETLKTNVANIRAKEERILTNYEEGYYTKEKRDERLTQIKTEVAEYRKQIVNLEQTNRQLSDLTNYGESGTLINLHRLPISGINEQPQETYQTIRRHVEKVVITSYEYNGKMQKLIEVTTKLGRVAKILYISKSKVKKNGTIYKLFKQTETGEYTPLYATPDFVPPYWDMNE